MDDDWGAKYLVANSFAELVEHLKKFLNGWVFRAQSSSWELESTLERAFKSTKVNSAGDRQIIEKNMIRDFQRTYEGDDKSEVQSDTLYCLSLMRHYGAPTRLLDCTRSIYVASYFALEYAYDNIPKNRKNKPDYGKNREVSVWCFNVNKLNKSAILAYGGDSKFEKHFNSRFLDSKRKDVSFVPLYMKNRYNIVIQENPLKMHKRLHLQQGAFLCPGNIKTSFEKNLEIIPRESRNDVVVKITWKANPHTLAEASNTCYRMNMTRESLFPGLDGYARSMQYQLDFYKWLGEERAKYGMG